MLIRKTSRSMEYQFMFRNSEQKHSTELSWIVSGWLSINISSSRFIISVQRLTAQAKLVTRCSGRLSSQYQTRLSDDPPENCHLNVKNCQKLDFFLNCQKLSFFKKIANGLNIFQSP